MSEFPLPTLLLGVIAACLVALTVAFCATAWELRGILRRLDVMLPDLEEALREARGSFRHLRRLLAGLTRAGRQVEVIVGRVCETASDAVERVSAMGRRLRTVFTEHRGNGAGADPRWRHRRR